MLYLDEHHVLDESTLFIKKDSLKKPFIPIVLFFICFIGQAQNRDADIKFRLAQSFDRSGNYESAVKLYEEVYATDSTNLVVFDALRRSYLQLKRYDDVISLIKRMLNKMKNDVGLLVQLGSAYNLKFDESKAVEAWEQAISINPKQEVTYRLVANAVVQNRMFERAIEIYRRGQIACANPALFTSDIAYLLTIMLNYTEATREYIKMIQQNPTQLSYVQSRIGTYTNRNEGLSAATLVIEQASRTESNNISLLQLLAWIYMEGKRFDQAYDIVKMIDEKTSASGRELYNFGERILKERAYTAASRAFLDVIARNPKFDLLPQAKFGYARTLEEMDAEHDTLHLFGSVNPFISKDRPETEAVPRYTGAISAYKRVIEEYPKSEIAAKSLYRIAVLKHERFFDLDGARVSLETLEKDYPNIFPIRLDGTLKLGDVYLALGNLQKAEEKFKYLSALRMPTGDYRDLSALRLAELDYFRGDFNNALQKLDEISKKTISNVANDAISLQIFIQENLKSSEAALKEFSKGDLLKRQWKLSEALSLFESILKINKNAPLVDETLMSIGDILTNMKRYAEALSAYERLMKDFPDNLAVDRSLMKMGEIYYLGLNEKTKAIESYQKLLEKYPNSIYISEARKRIRELRGDNI